MNTHVIYICILFTTIYLISVVDNFVPMDTYMSQKYAFVEGVSHGSPPIAHSYGKSMCGWQDDDTYCCFHEATPSESFTSITHDYYQNFTAKMFCFEMTPFRNFDDLKRMSAYREAMDIILMEITGVAIDLGQIYTCHLNPLLCPILLNTSIPSTTVFDFSDCDTCNDDGLDETEHCVLRTFTPDVYNTTIIKKFLRGYNANNITRVDPEQADCVFINMIETADAYYQDIIDFAICFHEQVAFPMMDRTMSALEHFYFGAHDPISSVQWDQFHFYLTNLQRNEFDIDQHEGLYDYGYFSKFQPCINSTKRETLTTICPLEAIELGMWCNNPHDDDDDCNPYTERFFTDFLSEDDCENQRYANCDSAARELVKIMFSISSAMSNRMFRIREYLLYARLYNPVNYVFNIGADVFPNPLLPFGYDDTVA